MTATATKNKDDATVMDAKRARRVCKQFNAVREHATCFNLVSVEGGFVISHSQATAQGFDVLGYIKIA